MENISFMWKNQSKRKYNRIHLSVLDDLGIREMIEHVFVEKSKQDFAMEKMQEICQDAEDILYRQEIFRELYENPELMQEMAQILSKLKELDIVQKSYGTIEKKSSLLQLTDRLRELKLYVEVILALGDTLSKRMLRSEGFQKVQKLVDEISKDKGFAKLQEDIDEIMQDMSLYQSITIGLNLDSMLNIEEVLLLSVNQFRHKKDLPLLKRFGHFLQDAAASNANIESGVLFSAKNTKQKDPIMKNLEHLMENEVEDLTKKLWRMLQNYVDMSGSALTKIIPELEFYLGFAKFFQKLKEKGLPVCLPQVTAPAMLELTIGECYNIKLFLKGESKEIITNDFRLDEEGNIFILTGPNSGGKTTFTQAVGCCILLAQQGLAVFAAAYQGRIFDGIYTHFPATEEETVNFGRLGEEARRIKEIMNVATENSIIFFNETYSSTSFSEGLFLAKDLVSALKYRNISAIYNTHMHELAADICELNAHPGKGKADSLVMGMEKGIRSYKVLRIPPKQSSYATDIARKYGVTYEQLIEV